MPTLDRIQAGLLRRLRRACDFRLVRWHRLAQHQQTWYLRKLFEWLQTDLVIDVGGNEGQYAKFIRSSVGYRGPLLTVEPIPELAEKLRVLASRDPNWTIVCAALGASEGDVEFKVMNTTPMSSLLEPKRDSPSPLMQYNRPVSRMQVPMKRLDRLIAEDPALSASRNVYLKLDVQGYELEVLKGAAGLMSAVGALQAELSVTPLYEGQPSYLQLLQFMEDAGYSPSLIPAHDYEQFPEMVDFDCHFLRRDLLKGYLGRLAGPTE